MKNYKHNYPLYEPTVFRDYRDMVESAAERFPDRPAISYRKNPRDAEAVRVNFRDAREEIRGIATGLIALGLREKKVALIGESSKNWVFSYYAMMASGIVTVPIDKEYTAPDMASILNTAECDAILYSPAILEKLPALKENVPSLKVFISIGDKKEEGDLLLSDVMEDGKKRFAAGDNSYYDYEIDVDKMASLVFTSGTTGKGKGVMLSTRNIVEDMTNGTYNFQMPLKTLNVLPPHHTFGSSVNLTGHYVQGIEVYISGGLRYIVDELKKEQPTHLILVPLFVETFYKRIWSTIEKQGKTKLVRRMIKLSNALLKVGIDLRKVLFKSITATFGGKLELIVCGGAALNQKIIDDFEAFGVTILNGYGITECSPLISCNRNHYRKQGSVGVPVLGELVKIANPNEDGEGEICVKGSNVMLGYYKEPEATAAVFDEEGYFHTGDLGKLDEEGWIYITGRLKNLIILSNGKNVYPEEIENELGSIYGVSEVVVYQGESKSDATKEVIVAEIFPDFEALKLHNIVSDEEIASGDLSRVQKYFDAEVTKCNAQMTGYKHVGLVKIRKEEFKKNTTRKITRFNIDKSID